MWLVLQVLPGTYAQSTPVNLGGSYLLVLLGIWLDLLVIAAFALLLCSLSTTPFLPLILGCFFALAGRSLGVALDYLTDPATADPDQARILLPLLEVAKWLLPDLSRLDWRDLALYDLWQGAAPLLWASLMALTYCVLLLALAARQFGRREFL
ncbi:hypothetical protein D3C78_1524200 [compost metagenome]